MCTISIIVPVYQVESFLRQCLDSILSQTYTSFEVILVDDGSTDESGHICDEYERKDKRVMTIHKDNGGLMAAWLDGLKVSRGSFVYFVDSDDWIEKNTLEIMYNHAINLNVDIVSCSLVIEHVNRSENIMQKLGGYFGRPEIEKMIFPGLLHNGSFCGRNVFLSRCTNLIRRDLILKNISFCNTQITIGEDVNIMFPVIACCQSIYILQKSFFYHYRKNYSSIINAHDSNRMSKAKLLCNTLSEIVEKLQLYDFRKQLDLFYVDMMILSIKNEMKSNSSEKYENMLMICNDDRLRFLFRVKTPKSYSRFLKVLLFGMKYRNTAIFKMLTNYYLKKEVVQNDKKVS